MKECVYCGANVDVPMEEREYLFPDAAYPQKLKEKLADEEIDDKKYTEYLSNIGYSSDSRGTMRCILPESEVSAIAKLVSGREPGYLIRGNEIQITIGRNAYTGLRICPECHSVLPDIKEGEKVLRIGLIASKKSGKTAFLCSLASHGMRQLMEGQKRFRFETVQRRSEGLEKRLSEPNQNLGWQIDPLYDDFALQVMQYENGIIQPSTEEQFSYPFLIRVKDIIRNKSLILVLYDIAGETLQKSLQASTQPDPKLSYLDDLDWVYYLVDPDQIFPDRERKQSQSGIDELMLDFEADLEKRLKYTGRTVPGASVIVTQSDDIHAGDLDLDEGVQNLLKRQKKGVCYDPERECLRRQQLRKLEPVAEVLKLLNSNEYRTVQVNMVSAIGCGVEERECELDKTVHLMKKDSKAKPQYMASPLYEMLLYLMTD